MDAHIQTSKKVLTSYCVNDKIILLYSDRNCSLGACFGTVLRKKEQIMTSVFGFLVAIIIVSIIVIIVDSVSRVLPKNSL